MAHVVLSSARAGSVISLSSRASEVLLRDGLPVALVSMACALAHALWSGSARLTRNLQSHRWDGGAAGSHRPACWWGTCTPKAGSAAVGTWHYSPGRGSKMQGRQSTICWSASLPWWEGNAAQAYKAGMGVEGERSREEWGGAGQGYTEIP